MRGLPAPAIILPILVCLLIPQTAFAVDPDIPIIVDGLPLDAKAITVRDEVFIPAWILENYAHTKVNWIRRGNLLEILTNPQEGSHPPTEGKLRMKVGFYLDAEGFVLGTGARIFLLNVEPKEFRFADGKTASDRAHEGAIDRIGAVSGAMREYLHLVPTDRFSPKGWSIVSRMPKEEIPALSATVERYEALHKSLFYDLVTNLVIEKEQQVNSGSVIDDALKGLKIEKIAVREDGTADVKAASGLYFIYGRMLYRNRQIVWDFPVALRGGETLVELSNRNAALMQ